MAAFVPPLAYCCSNICADAVLGAFADPMFVVCAVPTAAADPNDEVDRPPPISVNEPSVFEAVILVRKLERGR